MSSNAFGVMLLSEPAAAVVGSTALTTSVASSATNDRPRQATKNFQRIRGNTEASQRGLRPWTVRVTNQVAGISAASARLM